MRWELPALLWLVPLGAIAYAVLTMIARGVRVRRARQWSADLEATAHGVGRFGWIALVGAGAAAMVALAGPRWGSRVIETDTKGLNIVLAVDVSRSMLATDATPSRLERAKEQARRLIYEQQGDRVGLIAYAGNSFILSPLTVDASALLLLIDALDPDLMSTGGTEISRVLRQGRELLFAGDPVADRVLVLLTDGEGHDSTAAMREEAAALRREGVRLVVVAEGGLEPVPIPITDPEGNAIGLQRDPAGEVVQTVRRDDLMNMIADEAHGVVVPADLSDQAGAVHDLIAGYARAPQASSTAEEDISRAWIFSLVAVGLLLLHTVTRRTLALAALVLSIAPAAALEAQAPVNGADVAWSRGDFRAAAEQYLEQVREGEGGERAWYNLGTAGLAIGDTATARRALERTAASLDPDLRFRSLYNLALLRIRQAKADSQHAAAHLDDAFARLREALLLRSDHAGAKWNLELVLQRRPPEPPNRSGGGGGGGGATPPPEERSAALTPSQAEQILNSMAEEERQSMLDRAKRRGRSRETRGWKEW
jgi:Ca-activated chloride channel family protein